MVKKTSVSRVTVEVNSKKQWYYSKTVWVNFIALGALVSQSHYGFVISPEIQLALLTIVNVGLRSITKDEIVW